MIGQKFGFFFMIQLNSLTKWLKKNLSLNEVIVGQDEILQKGYWTKC